MTSRLCEWKRESVCDSWLEITLPWYYSRGKFLCVRVYIYEYEDDSNNDYGVSKKEGRQVIGTFFPVAVVT